MKNVFGIAIRTTIVTLVLTGLIYPFVMTGLAQVLISVEGERKSGHGRKRASHRLGVDRAGVC